VKPIGKSLGSGFYYTHEKFILKGDFEAGNNRTQFILLKITPGAVWTTKSRGYRSTGMRERWLQV
jgi:hypothetical protein